MNNYVRSIKCSRCGLVHANSMSEVCPQCGNLNQPAKAKKRKTALLISAGAAIAIWVCVVFIYAAQRNKLNEQPFTTSPQVSSGQQLGKPTIGLIVRSIDRGSPAMSAGLQVMDIVIQYGDTQVLDDETFLGAQEKYAKSQASSVEMTVVRNGGRINLTVPTGHLGFFSDEFNSVIMEFNGLIALSAELRKFPQEDYDRMVKGGSIKDDPQVLEKRAEQLIDKAEREGTLTKAQILTARIYLIPDKGTPQEEKKRQELLAQLLANQTQRYILVLAHDRFFQDQKYKAAIACMTQALKNDPSDVNTWLNMGNAYNSVSLFKEADAAADYVLKNQLPVSEYGYGVLFQIKALAAMGRGDYRNSMMYAERSFGFNPNGYMMSLWQLAAAQNSDLQQFYEISEKCRTAIPNDYVRLQPQVDAVEAYALAKSKRLDSARELINKWKGTNHIIDRVIRYWWHYPGGSDVVKNWKEAAKPTD